MDLEGQHNLMKFKKEAIDLKKEFRHQDNRKFFEDNRRKFKLFSGSDEKVYYNNNAPNPYQPVIYVASPHQDVEEIENTCQLFLKTWDENFPMQKLEKILQKLRTLISLDENCPVHLLFKFKIVKNLVECLTDNYDPFPTLQNETLWILINVFTSATGDMLEVFRSADFPAQLMRLLNRESNLFIAENVRPSDAAALVSLELPAGGA